MDPIEIAKVSLNALKANKIRSSLTMLGIIIGVASVILLVSIGSGLQNFITQQFEELGTNIIMVMPGKFQFQDEGGREGGPPGIGSNQLTLDLVKRFEKRADFTEAILPIVTKSLVAKYQNETHNTAIVGTSEIYPEIRKSPVQQGQFFSKSDVSGARKVAVIGASIAEELYPHTDPIGKKIILSDKRYQIIGVLEEKGSIFGQDQDDLVVIPITSASRHFDLEKLNYFYLKSPSADQIDKTVEEAELLLAKELDEEDFSVLSPTELLSTVSTILGVLTAALGGIAAISLLVGGIGIMNIMLVSVTERTREIGLRKAIGATPKNILTQFLIEATVLSFVGGLIGILLGFLGALIMNRFLQTSVTLWSVLLASGVSAIVGIIFGVTPAYKASRLNPIDALRYE
jgi:putative ABC transport system permease protein